MLDAVVVDSVVVVVVTVVAVAVVLGEEVNEMRRRNGMSATYSANRLL